MNIILVATDFSTSATNAVEYASSLALTLNAELCLLHVSQIPMIIGDVPRKEEETEINENAQGRLEELKKMVKLKTAGKVPVDIQLQVGDFNQELQLVCDELNPFLVVLGSQGGSPVERFFLGSHTVHAMRHLSWPLITVPLQVRFSMVKRIGLAYDFEQDMNRFDFETLKSIVNAFQAELHVINIGKKKEIDATRVFEPALLEEKLKDLKPDYHFITGQDANAGILDFSEKNQMDLLIVLPGIHGLFENINHRSHGKQFILHSHVPVVSIRQLS
jgi:nucleotide-binding universal stress UspA family protein